MARMITLNALSEHLRKAKYILACVKSVSVPIKPSDVQSRGLRKLFLCYQQGKAVTMHPVQQHQKPLFCVFVFFPAVFRCSGEAKSWISPGKELRGKTGSG
jgi:hypothetical protein